MPDPRHLRLAGFGVCYLLLQWAATYWRDAGSTDWLIERATARPAGRLIAVLWPQEHVRSIAAGLAWPGGSLQLLRGCDGLEVLTLYVAAVLVAPVGWRRGLVMLGLGLATTWLSNQLRVLLLYWSWRHWPSAFDALHVIVAPVVLLLVLLALFRALLQGAR